MSKLDKAKEHINMLKIYMGILIALLISDISGTVKLFQNNDTDATFWVGVVSIILLSLGFAKLAKYAHNKIDELEEL
ncbi:MAG TPA: hypothetical protein EYG98_03795 [Sulfurovum sp.]|nr:hypothetical protein [Sulfurovum sp.]